MSTTVDTRVVQMKFDNQRFRENIQETIDSLKQLDKSLQLEDSAKGLENLTKAAKEVNLDPLAKSVETVKVKFSALEVAAITALTNITNKAVNAGEKLLKSLSVDNIAAGWQKFEDTTTSVGTLISQGFSMEEVEKQLEKLNWYTDETSYNFTDMVSNIGKFTATGQDLETSVNSMMGIANWAALSGQNAQKASMAMYQLSQAMSKGVLKYDDWKSISNAAMDTKEFRQQAVEAAVAAGTLKRNANGLFTTLKGHTVTLNELFSSDYMSRDAWFTSNVMIDTFKKYASAVNDIYDVLNPEDGSESPFSTASEAIAGMSDQLDAFGVKAFKAAQEARTWSDVVNSVKDAVGSTWKSTFEYIFGNYEEAKRLFTGLANLLYGVFAESGNTRNEILKLWKFKGGRSEILEGLASGFYAIKDAFDAVKDVWNAIFHPNANSEDDIITEKADKLYDFSVKFRQFMQGIALDEKGLQNLTDAFAGIFSFIKMIRDTVTEVIKFIFPSLKDFKSLTGIILAIAGAIGRVLSVIVNYIREANIAEIVTNALAKVFKTLGLVIAVAATAIYQLVKNIKNLVLKFKELKPVQKIVEGLQIAFGAIAAAAYIAYTSVKNFITVLTNPELASQSNNVLIKFIYGVIGALQTFVGWIVLTGQRIANFFASLKGLNPLEKIKAIFGKIQQVATDLFKKIFGDPTEATKGLLDTLSQVGEKFTKFFHELDVGTVVALAFTVTMVGVAGAIANLLKTSTGLIGNISGLVGTVKKIIVGIYTKSTGVLQIAEAFAILAGSLWLLCQVPIEDLKAVIVQMGIVMAALLGVYGLITAINALLSKHNLRSGWTSEIGLTLIGMAAAILSVAGTLLVLQNVTLTPQLLGNLGIVLAAVGVISLIGAAINKFTYNKTTFGPKSLVHMLMPIITIATLAGSLHKMVDALKDLQDVNAKQLLDSTLALVPVIIAFGVLAAGVGQIKLSSVLALLLVLKMMELIIPEIGNIMTPETTEKLKSLIESQPVLIAAGVTLGVLAVLIGVLAARGKEIQAGAKGIAKLVVAMVALIGFVTWLSTQEITFDWNVAGIFVMVGAFVGVVEYLSKFTENNKMTKFAAGMLLLSGAMMMMVSVINLCKKLELTLTDTIPFIVIGFIVAWVENLASETANAKVMPLVILFGGIFSLLTMLIAISTLPFNKILASSAALTGIMLALGVVVLAIGKLSENSKNIFQNKEFKFLATLGSNIAKFVSSLAVMAAVVAAAYFLSLAIANVNVSTIQEAGARLTVIGGLLIVIGGITTLLANTGNSNIFNFGNILAKAAVIASFVAVIKLIADALATMDTLNNAVENAKIVGALILEIGVISTLLGLIKGVAISGLVLLAVGLTAVGIALSKYTQYFKDFVNTLKDLRSVIADNPIGTVIRQITDGVSELNEKKDEIRNKFYALGVYIIEGYTKGITDNLDKVELAGRKMALAVEKGEREASATESPSKVFMSLGAFLVAGMVNGITSGFDLLQSTGEGIVEIVDEETAKAGDIVVDNVATTGVNVLGTVATGAEEVNNMVVDTGESVNSNIEEIGKNAVDSTNDTFATILQNEGTFAESFKQIMKLDINNGIFGEKGFKGLIDNAKLLGSSIADYFKKSVADIKNNGFLFNKAADWVGKKAGIANAGKSANVFAKLFNLPTLEDGESYFDYFSRLIKNKAPQFAKDIFEAISGGKDGSEVINDIKSSLERFKEEFGIGGDELFNAENVGDWANAISGANGALGDLNNTALQTKSTFESLAESINSAISPFSEFNRDMTKTPEEMLEALKTNIFGISEWTNNLTRLAERGLSQDLLTELGNKGPSSYAEVAAYAQMSDSQIKEANAMYEMLLKIPASSAYQVTKSYQYAGEMAVQGFSDALSEFAGVIDTANIGEESIEGIRSGMEKVFPSVHELVQNSGLQDADWYAQAFNQNIEAFLYNLWPQIIEPGTEEIAKNVNNASETAGKSASTSGKKGFSNQYKQDSKEVEKEVTDATVETGKTAGKAGGAQAASSFAQAFADNYMKELEANGVDPTALGEYVAKGVGTGITNESQFVKDRMQELVSNCVISPATASLMINSPSKVMAEIGKFAVEGLVVGMQDKENDLTSESSGIANIISTVIDNAIAYMEQDNEFSPVLTPVLDLSAIQNGAGALDTILSTKQVSVASAKFDANKLAAKNAEMNVNSSRLEEVINGVSDRIIRAITDSDTPVNVTVALEGDSSQIFKIVRQENSKFTKINGYNALAR